MRWSKLLFTSVLAVSFSHPLWAETSMPLAPPSDEATLLEPLVVTGVVTGPGLWQVVKDDHRMWVLGTVQPVAKKMQWESAEVREYLQASSVVLLPARLSMSFEGVGRFRLLMMAPKLMGLRKNPERERLEDRVSAEDYQRWLVLKKKYLGRDRGVEKRRPLIASQELYEAAVKKHGLEYKGLLTPLIKEVAKETGLVTIRPELKVEVANLRERIDALKTMSFDDTHCFQQVLEHLEKDISKMRHRAEAWSDGDIETLRRLDYVDFGRSCTEAVLSSKVAEEAGLSDLPKKLSALWLEEAEKVLAEHKVSFAVLTMNELVSENGLLNQLQARGYEVRSPK